MIRVQHLTKKFGKFPALLDVSFHVPEGELVGLIGPNGAGKTTTFRCLSGLLAPNEGSMHLDDKEVVETPDQVRNLLGYLPEGTPLLEELTVQEYLQFRFRLKQQAGVKNTTVEECLELCDLGVVRKRVIAHLSAGYRKRVGVAEALLGSPRILLLDEPTNGLDPEQVVRMRNLLVSLKGERTLIVSSHILSELELICDRFIILGQGHLKAFGTRTEILERQQVSRKYEVGICDPGPNTLACLETLPRLQKMTPVSGKPHTFEIHVDPDFIDPCKKIHDILHEEGGYLSTLNPIETDLESIYLELIKNENTNSNS